MLRFLRIPTRRHTRRFIQFLCILFMGACTEQCEDPTGPDYQATVAGSVTVNGEGVAGVPVSAGSYGTTTTASSGSYSIRMQGDIESFLVCVTLGGVYGIAQEATVQVNCPLVPEGTTRTEDFSFEHAPPTLRITSPQDGAMLPDGSGTDLRVVATYPLSLNGRRPLLPPSVSWSSSLGGALGDWSLDVSPSADLPDGNQVVTATLVDLFGFSASDAVTVQVGGTTAGTGSIQGVVSVDAEPLAEVPVTLSGAGSASTTTNVQGAYTFLDLGPGTYTITIAPPPGVDMATTQVVTLGEGEALTVNFSG